MRLAILSLILVVISKFNFCNNNNGNDQKLLAHLETVNLVIVGEILSIHKIPNVIEPISEHSPNWHLAIIKVENIVKTPFDGNAHQFDTFAINFPNSKDVIWADIPKPQIRQKGIFLAHVQGFNVQGEDGQVFAREGFALLDSLDFQELDKLPKLSKILKEAE